MAGRRGKEDIPGLHLFFREIYNKGYNSPIGYQTQMNIIDKEHGILKPEQYIPVSEISNQCVRLAHWQVEIICRLMKGFEKKDKTYDWISAFVSATAMDKAGFAEDMISTIKAMEIRPADFAFELPASILDNVTEQVLDNVNILREEGLVIIIRDYGVSYSAVMKLCQMPIDYCIIEQSLAQYMIGSEKEQKMYANLIKMIKDMGIEVISDGVDLKTIMEAWTNDFESDNAIGKKIGTWFDEDRLGINRREIQEIVIDDEDEQ